MSVDPTREPWLGEAFHTALQAQPGRKALVMLANDGSERAYSAGELDALAGTWQAALGEAGLERGEIVVLALRHSETLVGAFLGAAYLGVTPTIYPYVVPRPSTERFSGQMRQLVESSGASAVVTIGEYVEGTRAALDGTGCRVIGEDAAVGREPEAGGRAAGGDAGAPAYVQYTSGTTGMSKGVVISHRAMVTHAAALAAAQGVTDRDVMVSWMPLYHDGGLVHALVMPLLVGIPTVLLSPFRWVRSPGAFFSAVSRHRGTISSMPNSGFHHAVDAVRESDMEGVDLGTLRLLLDSAEPVWKESLDRFVGRFERHGLRANALAAAYGMAEATLSVTSSPPGEGVRADRIDAGRWQLEGVAAPVAAAEGARSVTMVSSGRAIPGVVVRIVDDAGEEVGERHAGEIAVNTPFLFSGYHRRPGLAESRIRDGWFRTGDVGYVAEGELYVCGRKSDVIILAGRNVHPEDVERIATGIEGVCADGAAAFGVPDERLGTERLVLACDLERGVREPEEKTRIERRVRRAVYEELEVPVSEVQLGRRGWVIKTPNGKLMRKGNRERYLVGPGRGEP